MRSGWEALFRNDVDVEPKEGSGHMPVDLMGSLIKAWGGLPCLW
jgi:hypothetical protein